MDCVQDIIEKELTKINLKRCLGKKILLMGRIEHVLRISAWLKIKGFETEAILDNDRKKQGMYVGNLPIVAPKQVVKPFRKDVFIIIYSPKYWEDMCIQLAEYGYIGNKYVYVLDKPNLYKNIWMVKKGICIYHNLQREYGKNVFIFLMNCPLGDFYLMGLYFHQYCRDNQVDNYVVVGISRGIEKLSTRFQLKAVKRLTDEESNALIRAWIFLGDSAIRLKPLTIWQGAFRFNPCQVRQKEGFSFMDTFTKMIYSLEKPIPCYPDWQGDRKLVKKVFIQNGMKQGKTVILSPFSYSLQSLPSAFWIQVADLLREKGYSIAVNVGEEREYNFIVDSVSLRMDFPEIIIALELAGTVIGMRSGFFDITAQAKCRRIVLYPPSLSEHVDWNSTDIGFCSLKKMGLCEDAYEWEVKEPEEICKKILMIL